MNVFFGILMDAFFIALLIWCAYTDMRTRTISNLSVTLLLCLALAHMLMMIISCSTWWTYPAGIALAAPFFVAWLRGQMGTGDVKLAMSICLYLGILNTLIAFVFMVPVLIGHMVRSWIKKDAQVRDSFRTGAGLWCNRGCFTNLYL